MATRILIFSRGVSSHMFDKPNLQVGHFCYYANGFEKTVVVVVEGEPGFYSTDFTFDTPAIAEAYANRQNETMGLSKTRIMEIVASSHRAQNMKVKV
jgi:hypothetical protein